VASPNRAPACVHVCLYAKVICVRVQGSHVRGVCMHICYAKLAHVLYVMLAERCCISCCRNLKCELSIFYQNVDSFPFKRKSDIQRIGPIFRKGRAKFFDDVLVVATLLTTC
jgi:hypothetical protein